MWDRFTAPVSLRSAWLMRRACSPTCVSPISPSISARGTSAATESIDHHVDRVAPDQHLGDLERLLARVRLGDQQVVDVHTELPRVLDVERVLGVDEGRDPAVPLRVRDDWRQIVVLPDDSGPIDLADASSRDPADPDRRVEIERTRRDRVDARLGPPSAPIRMIAPLPYDRSIWVSAVSRAFRFCSVFLSVIWAVAMSPPSLGSASRTPRSAT